MARPPIRPIAHRRRRLCGRIKNSLKFYSKRRFSSCTDATPRLNTASQQRWPVRLSVRTPGFQPGKRGSIPLRAATFSSLNVNTFRAFVKIKPLKYCRLPKFFAPNKQSMKTNPVTYTYLQIARSVRLPDQSIDQTKTNAL